MPKMKTHSGTAKRFKLTGTGKVMRRRANRNHLLEHKSSRVRVGSLRNNPSPKTTSGRSRSCWESSPARELRELRKWHA